MMPKRKGGFRTQRSFEPAKKKQTGSRRPATPAPERTRSPKRASAHQAPDAQRPHTSVDGKPPAAGKPRTAGKPPATKKRGGWQPDDVVLSRLKAQAITAEQAHGVSFEDLGLGPRIVRTLGELGAQTPFPIQVATIPDILGGRDVLGRGRTGSGKTIAFGAALVERLLNLGRVPRTEGRPPRALILAPTRELALQIDRTVQPIARSVGLFTTQLYGGVPYSKQQTALGRGVDIVIGTPGRIEDLVERGRLDLSQVVITVLDEADEMTDMGFLEPVQRILEYTRPGGQRLLFSATLDSAVLRIVDQFMPDPAVHEVAGEAAAGDIRHRVLVVDRSEKDAVIAQLAAAGGKVLIFSRTRAGAERIAGVLSEAGVKAVALHGDLTQARRSLNLADLTSGKVDVLVATDVAARGIHIDDVRLVVQADPAEEYKTYLHRAGRTGRAGRSGTVVSIIAPSRRRRMAELLERAEIDAPMIPASAGGAELDEFAA